MVDCWKQTNKLTTQMILIVVLVVAVLAGA
ncbi:MAG: hypothetical protein EZS28_043058, partial [Streblomastix strix]